MNILILLIGLFLVGIGFWVRRYPNAIAGYNTMSKKEKENVDIEGLSVFMFRCMVAMGIAVVVFFYLLVWMGWTVAATLVPLFVPLVFVFYMLVKQRKYDHNAASVKKNKKRTSIAAIITAITASIVVIIVAVICYGLLPTKVEVTQKQMVIGGMYGMTRDLEELESVTLSDTLPTLTYRMNGLAVGKVRKGWFKLRDGGKCLLFLCSGEAPYIVVTDTSGLRIFLNARTPEQTLEIYHKF